MENSQNFTVNCNYIFLDFDGVVKDSLEVKSLAFFKLFEEFGQKLAYKIKNHHEANSGVSRYDKLPIYLNWAGKTASDELIAEYSRSLSSLLKKNVVNSNWVPGVKEFIKESHKKHNIFLVTATPLYEIEEILLELKIRNFFVEVVGAPTKKADGINYLIKKYSILPKNSTMIGDSINDYDAAQVNSVPFILRRTRYNVNLQDKLECPMIYNFL